jgi:MoaA/NifB/PqqE/SkfB family radical SAM enzyme
MKRNLAELPEIINLGRRLGADQFSITNVYPHTSELREEILFSQSLYENAPNSYGNSLIALPRADITPISANLLGTLARTGLPLSFARQGFNPGTDSCPFLEKGSVSVRWDGAVSPCLALLHTHDSYLDDRLRRSYAYTIGNLSEQKLEEIWEEPAYVVFRERLLQFDFSFCTYCNSCDMADSNLEDCFGNTHPTCGGCLWAQGFIQCP